MTLSPSASPAPNGSGAMFDRISARYDLMNRLMTLGRDQVWRRQLVNAVALPPRGLLLDVATGTGDVAILAASHYPEAEIVGVDSSEQMLAVARRKVARSGLAERIRLTRGEAASLPFGDATVDAVTVAFGLRNFADRPAALAELLRVLKPGGRVAILEIGQPQGWLAPLARCYTRLVVPGLGAILSGRAQYRYLVTSAAAFPHAATVVTMIERAGFAAVGSKPVSVGGVCLFSGSVPGRA